MDTSLTDRGVEQARRAGEWLQGVPFGTIYSSDLARAADTARAIAERQDIPEIVFDRDLREMHYGVLQGVPIADFSRVLEPYGVASDWGNGAFSARGLAPPGGESVRMLRNRVTRFVARLEADHQESEHHSVLVVTHGGFLRVMLTVLLQLPTKSRHAFAFDNCSVTRVTIGSDITRLDYHNFVVGQDAAAGSAVPSE